MNVLIVYDSKFGNTERIARAIGASDAARGLYDLSRKLNAKLALRDIGMPEDGIDRAADLAVTNAYWNPRPLERDAIRALIARAFAGERPASLIRAYIVVERSCPKSTLLGCDLAERCTSARGPATLSRGAR